MLGAPSTRTLAGRELRTAIRASVAKFLDLQHYSVFLFGSEATGAAVEPRSDIDVGILGPQPVPGALMQRIRDDLDGLRTLRSFDLVDFAVVDVPFRREALLHAERL